MNASCQAEPIHFAVLCGEVLRRSKWKLGDVLPDEPIKCHAFKARHLGAGKFLVTSHFEDATGDKTHEEEEVIDVSDIVREKTRGALIGSAR